MLRMGESKSNDHYNMRLESSNILTMVRREIHEELL
jgi:hypothetical protein